jgi:hypothetical protein
VMRRHHSFDSLRFSRQTWELEKEDRTLRERLTLLSNILIAKRMQKSSILWSFVHVQVFPSFDF